MVPSHSIKGCIGNNHGIVAEYLWATSRAHTNSDPVLTPIPVPIRNNCTDRYPFTDYIGSRWSLCEFWRSSLAVSLAVFNSDVLAPFDGESSQHVSPERVCRRPTAVALRQWRPLCSHGDGLAVDPHLTPSLLHAHGLWGVPSPATGLS